MCSSRMTQAECDEQRHQLNVARKQAYRERYHKMPWPKFSDEPEPSYPRQFNAPPTKRESTGAIGWKVVRVGRGFSVYVDPADSKNAVTSWHCIGA